MTGRRIGLHSAFVPGSAINAAFVGWCHSNAERTLKRLPPWLRDTVGKAAAPERLRAVFALIAEAAGREITIPRRYHDRSADAALLRRTLGDQSVDRLVRDIPGRRVCVPHASRLIREFRRERDAVQGAAEGHGEEPGAPEGPDGDSRAQGFSTGFSGAAAREVAGA